MTPNPYTISPDSSVSEALRGMAEHKHTHLPVVERQTVVGMITMKDIGARTDLNHRGTTFATRYFSSEQENLLHKIKVRDVMPPDQVLVVIPPDAFIEQAAILLLDNKIRGLPVVDDAGKLVGIITQTDILAAFLELLAINRQGSRINLRVTHDPATLTTIGQILTKNKVQIENLVTMETNGDDHLMILRIDTMDCKPIVNDLKAAGMKVESTWVKQ
jgi:acetoin utilization protein AcuB